MSGKILQNGWVRGVRYMQNLHRWTLFGSPYVFRPSDSDLSLTIFFLHQWYIGGSLRGQVIQSALQTVSTG